MKPTGFPLVPVHLLVTTLILLSGAAPAPAQSDDGPPPMEDPWQETYPAPVSNITQHPWNVTKGEDVMVALTLTADAKTPERVSMIWCRVEPDYVCALPLLMVQEDERTWTATIPGSSGAMDDVIQEETRHIGYNISLQYAAPDENTTGQRVWAPINSPWTPADFPADTVGEYYFIRLQDAQNAPLPILSGLLVLLATLLLVLPRSKTTEKTLHPETRRRP